MFKREMIKISETLLKLFRQRKINVGKIILFGSYAKGTQKNDSDLDIIIVSKDFRNKDVFERVKFVRGVSGAFVREIDQPVDMMYYSDVEWNKGNSIVINAAKHEGKVIYDEKILNSLYGLLY